MYGHVEIKRVESWRVGAQANPPTPRSELRSTAGFFFLSVMIVYVNHFNRVAVFEDKDSSVLPVNAETP